jgi:hypothetical protein
MKPTGRAPILHRTPALAAHELLQRLQNAQLSVLNTLSRADEPWCVHTRRYFHVADENSASPVGQNGNLRM